MVKKAVPPPPSPPVELVVPRKEAAARITGRVEAGRDLLKRPISNTADYDTLYNDHKKWSAFNRELLKRLFSTSEMSDEYDRFYGAAFVMGAPVPWTET